MGLNYGMKLFKAAQECTGKNMPDEWRNCGEKHLLRNCHCFKTDQYLQELDVFVQENCDHSQTSKQLLTPSLVCKVCAVKWAVKKR